MHFFSILTGVTVSLAFGAHAFPVLERVAALDDQIAQFALTLEHLESAFYSQGLAKWDASAFKAAGYPDFVRDRIVQIGQHETTHVVTLTKVLGSKATKACTYQFPDTDVKSFVALSGALETGGVSAYLGALHLLKNPEYVTAAGSILTTEARQAAWVNSVVLNGSPWSTSFDVPLSANTIFSVVAGLIKTCPSTNPKLIAKAFPTLTISDGKPGSKVKVTFAAHGQSYWLALFTGLRTLLVPVKDGYATLPTGLQGTVFAVVTNSRTVSDKTTVAGTAVLSFGVDENANNSQ